MPLQITACSLTFEKPRSDMEEKKFQREEI
jgi:hypothetical protein